MKVLSLFDGISCARVALERAKLPVEEYYASEIDKYAIEISKKNWPDIYHIGDVKLIANRNLSVYKHDFDGGLEIDLLIGGSPCQDLSIAKKNRKGLDGERSGLFWEYVRLLKLVKPKYFVLENVASMPKEAREVISRTLGVEPIMINASLVSAQNRKRLFWVGERIDTFECKYNGSDTNGPITKTESFYKQVEIPQPQDMGILLQDILEKIVDDKYFIDNVSLVGKQSNNGKDYSRNFGQGDRVYSPYGKSTTLSALGGGRGAKTGLYHVPHGYKNEKITEEDKYPTLHAQNPASNHLIIPNKSKTIRTSGRGSGYGDKHNWDMINHIRKLTPIECERLQGLPDNYTEGVSNTQRYKALGNAFNVDVVAHILSFIK